MTECSIEVSRDNQTKGLQLSIWQDGIGYRIAGPKILSSEVLLTHVLTQDDANEIRMFLNNAFPEEKE